ncbi:hypothetical protein PTSG_01878 [Salpingoeca rosetta]|uniref:Insulin degrading enzyme n=1 Tax=Salpingoeca rosetta (strain ATCC 50818 / BSB-021) TaxID=946362 RepID=F2TZ78_SALR5|nr:uncharacterized protein PTSG_01878 [Salpingoeca rosetta]EGD78902.1 hypothetical protein PTSG_01878 [Salpingoeca rosetta]|eukprot:XP_004997858.1 hypothetical protein PTSG_01878 [Salpingoeca rosetta]
MFGLCVVWGLAEAWWAGRLWLHDRVQRVSGDAGTRVSPVAPMVPQVDRKQYRIVRLKNDLRVLLVQDEPVEACGPHRLQGCESATESSAEDDTTDAEDSSDEDEGDDDVAERHAAVALSIAAGSFEDPPEAPGLAHFLEHMVFMGSSKYPEEDALEDFLQSHSGYSNAHTEAEQTCFYFDIDPPHLSKALDIFAQFFVDPLLLADAVDRERQAVDSEFKLALQDDYSRTQQVVFAHARKDSVLAHFTWGNDESLKDLPKKAGKDIRKLLFDFHAKHYNAENMCAVVRGPQSLDELQAMAEASLSAIPRGRGPLRNDGTTFPATWEHAWNTADFHQLFFVAPIKDDHELFLIWNFESLFETWRVKPMMYVSELVGHEGKGSILHRLQELRWCTGLTAGNSGDGAEASSRHCFFQIVLTLTDEGLRHVREIVMIVMQYLTMIRTAGPQRHFFDECKQISENHFRFQQDSESIDFVEGAACEMPYYPDANIFNGDVVIMDYDADTITKLIGRLTFGNMLAVVSSKSVADMCTLEERWFGTKYAKQSFPPDWTDEALAIEAGDTPCPAFLHMPPPNPFVASDFEFKEKTDANKEPVVIFSTKDIECWHLHDNTHHVPRTGIMVQLCNSVMTETARGRIAGQLLVTILRRELKEELYQAEIADLEYDIRSDELGISFSVTGYSSKVDLVFRILCSRIFHLTFDAGVFAMSKEKLLRSLYNQSLDPSNVARELRLTCLCPRIFEIEDMYTALKSMSLKDMQSLYSQLMRANRAVLYVHGNATKEDAMSALSELQQRRPSTPYSQFSEQHVLKLTPGFLLCRAENRNEQDVNNALQMYFQVQETDKRAQATHRLLSNMVEEPFFQDLRTRQQLGYSVSLSKRNTYNKPGFVAELSSPSDKFSTNTMIERVEAFLSRFGKKLRKMSSRDFEDHKESLRHALLAPDANQDRRISKFWFSIRARIFTFSHSVEAEHLKTITKKEVVDMYMRYLHPSSKERAVLVIAVNSTQETVVPLEKTHDSVTSKQLRERGEYAVWPAPDAPVCKPANGTNKKAPNQKQQQKKQQEQKKKKKKQQQQQQQQRKHKGKKTKNK